MIHCGLYVDILDPCAENKGELKYNFNCKRIELLF